MHCSRLQNIRSSDCLSCMSVCLSVLALCISGLVPWHHPCNCFKFFFTARISQAMYVDNTRTRITIGPWYHSNYYMKRIYRTVVTERRSKRLLTSEGEWLPRMMFEMSGVLTTLVGVTSDWSGTEPCSKSSGLGSTLQFRLQERRTLDFIKWQVETKDLLVFV